MKNPNMQELRIAIRELLAEEISRLHGEQHAPATGHREERVSLGDDAALSAFVRRLGALYADPATRADIEAGRHRFRLAGRSAPEAGTAAAASNDTASIDATLVGEREVNALAPATRHLQVARKTRFTPLAKDALRRRGITITRSDS